MRLFGRTMSGTVGLIACALGVSSTIVACDAPIGPAMRVASLAVSPDTLSTSPLVFADHRHRISVAVKDSTGRTLPGVLPKWSSTNPNVATVTSDGSVVARQYGEVNVTAAVARVHTTVHISVTPYSDTNTVVIAHRGFADIFPENTLVGIRGAYDKGADAVEIDVRVSRDSVPVIIHDATVDRTTNGTGPVSSFTAQALQELDACSKRSPIWGRCPVPTLWAALQAARGRGWLLLHLQDRFPRFALPIVLQVVHLAQLDDQVIYISFDYALLRALRARDPAIPLGLLVRRALPIDSILQIRPAALLLPADSLLALPGGGREYVQQAKAAGLDVGAWTIWSASQGRALLAAGNIRLITDDPLDKTQLR